MARGTIFASRGPLKGLAIACSTTGGDVKDASLGQGHGGMVGCISGTLGGVLKMVKEVNTKSYIMIYPIPSMVYLPTFG